MRTYIKLVAKAFSCDEHRARYYLARLDEVGMTVAPNNRYRVLEGSFMSPERVAAREVALDELARLGQEFDAA